MLSTTTNTTSGGATQQSQSLSDALNLLYVAIAKGDLSAVEVSEDNDIAFLADGQLRAATLEKLIYLLPCNSDPYYLLHFLITFRSFCSPEELLRKLVDVWDNSAFASYTSRELDVFRIKYMNVVKTWLDKHFYDFTPQLVHNVTEFLDKHHEAIGPVTCHSMKKLIKRNTDRIEKKVVYSVVPSSAPILPPDFAACELGPLALDPLELARQMTLLDEQQYKSILPRECMNQCWNKGTQADQQERAPHVVRMILRFNAVSAWVTRCIVSEPLVKKRKTILTRMIKLAQHLRQIHNYHSLLAVVAALESASVTRLKKTWEAVDKSYLQQLQDLKALMSAEGSYKSFRAALHSEDPPCIPYLGVYLADLTFIEDGNPDRVPSADDSGRELINFAKMRMLAKVIDEIRFYQQDPFAFEPVPRIQEYLQNEELSPISEKDAYELSLKAEPRPPVK
jgi:son of sevenless-like protein